MKRIAAVGKNIYLLRKIELTASACASVTLLNTAPSEYFDMIFWDIDTMGEPPSLENLYTVSREGTADLEVPFAFETLLNIIEREGRVGGIVCRGRFAYLRGEKIKLTELEAALLTRLIAAGGEFVSRADILRDVWGEGSEQGIVNVYIHYLREKLERGEKIIISSRSLGYKLDGRYV